LLIKNLMISMSPYSLIIGCRKKEKWISILIWWTECRFTTAIWRIWMQDTSHCICFTLALIYFETESMFLKINSWFLIFLNLFRNKLFWKTAVRDEGRPTLKADKSAKKSITVRASVNVRIYNTWSMFSNSLGFWTLWNDIIFQGTLYLLEHNLCNISELELI